MSQVSPNDKELQFGDGAVSEATRRGKARALIEERRRMVLRYMIRGLSASQMVGLLEKPFPGIKRSIVEQDIRWNEKEMQKRVTKVDVNLQLGSSMATFAELKRELWKQYHDAGTPTSKASILGSIQGLENDSNRLLERMGLLVPTTKVIVEMGDSWENTVRRLREQRGLDKPLELDEGVSKMVFVERDDDDEIAPLGEQLVIDADYKEG